MLCVRRVTIGASRDLAPTASRRTAATRLNNAGVPLCVIQQIGGWSSLAALQRYSEVTPDQVEEAIAKL